VGDNELGMFLRARREATRPADVGLGAGPRRRTPGLRRAEVATLAGVSVEYLVRLEQGRHRRPSAQVLSALAEALRLTPSERVHLYRLSKGSDPGFTCRGDAAPGRFVRSGVRALLERLEPAAAVLLNRATEQVAWTAGYERLAAPAGLLDGTPPTLARFVLADPRARDAYPDWDRVADHCVALLKQGPFRADAHVAALADELSLVAGDEFTGRVATVPGLPAANGVLRMIHPDVGAVRLTFETLDLPADDDQRMVVYLPADEASSAALSRLDGRRTHRLRAVSG
jgi:transcriptional regulator with XRE-family HTH domain